MFLGEGTLGSYFLTKMPSFTFFWDTLIIKKQKQKLKET